jgi:hypothetical protein
VCSFLLIAIPLIVLIIELTTEEYNCYFTMYNPAQANSPNQPAYRVLLFPEPFIQDRIFTIQQTTFLKH